MKAELTIVANASEAHLFSRETRQDPLMPIALLKHPQSRWHVSLLATDRDGHGNADHRPSGTTFSPRMSRRRKEHLLFADEISRRLDSELDSGRYDSVVLFAACPFIGELRRKLSPAAKAVLHAAIDLDLTSFPVDELERRVEAVLLQQSREARARSLA